MIAKRFWQSVLGLVKDRRPTAASFSLLAVNHDHAESQLFNLTNKYFGDFFRPMSRNETISTNLATEYSPLPETDFHSPFADYLADDSKVWTLYLDVTKSKGEELMRIWNSDLDTILIFAGLFSAILTAFLIETRKSLQPDSANLTNNLLVRIIDQLQDRSSASFNASMYAAQFQNYTPPTPFLWINGLWFVSLTFSLAGALGSILAKGWVAQFIPISAGVPIIDACNRHRRFFGDDQRHLRAVIASLPVTLHIGFYLFFAGLVVLLFQDDNRIAVIVTCLLVTTMILYLGCSFRPILNPNSPFRTPISGVLPVIPLILLPVILLCDVLGHAWFSKRERQHKKKHIIQIGPYTFLESLCLIITDTRKLWLANIAKTIGALYRLMLVTTPPSDELRADVLVQLFALARHNKSLDDSICALAALPATPRLQEALYNTDPLPTLLRNITEVFSNPQKIETSSLAQAYLNVLLSLVQTTNSSLNWSPGAIMPLLEPGGILSFFDAYHGDILELIICIQIHVRVRAGFLLPSSFTASLPEIIIKCTNPHHQCLLMEACLTLSVIDGGTNLEQLVADDVVRQVLLDLNLGNILANMIKNPQKRVQKAALTAISALCVDESSRTLLIEENIVKLLLEHIPGSDSQLQCEALSILPAFIKYGITNMSDKDQDIIQEPPAIQEWIEDIFGLFLVAMLKSQQLNVQEASVSALSSYLRFEYTRAEFLRLGHINTLLNMLNMNGDSSLQLATLSVLKVLLSHEDSHECLDSVQFSQQMASILNSCVYPIKKNVLDFILYCLSFSNTELKERLTEVLEQPLIKLFSVEHTVPELTDKISMILYVLSSSDSTCNILLSSKFIFHLINIAKSPGLNTQVSVNLAQKSLINMFKSYPKSSTFSERILNDLEKQPLCHSIIRTIEELLDANNSAFQFFSMDLLLNCLNYYDLRQLIYNSRIINILGCKLRLGSINIKKSTLNILLKVVGYDDLQSTVIKPSIVESLLDIVWKDWSQLSDPSLKLLTICMRKSRFPVVLLPCHAEDTLGDLLNSRQNHSLLAAMTILAECSRPVDHKNYHAIVDLMSSQIIDRVIGIFCTTTQLVIQDEAGKALHNLIINDHFRPMLATDHFYSAILKASITGDVSFQSSALEIIVHLSKFGDSNYQISNLEHLALLMDLLHRPVADIQILILKILLNVLHFENVQSVLVSYNIFDQLFILGKCPDIKLANVVLKFFNILFKFDHMRHKIDSSAFMRLMVYLICSRNLELQQMSYETFSLLTLHDDIHHKLICPNVITLLFTVSFQDIGQFEPNPNLTGNERVYLTKIIDQIQEISHSSIQELTQDLLIGSPIDPLIRSHHAALDFQQSQDLSLGSHAIQDSDSGIFYLDSRE